MPHPLTISAHCSSARLTRVVVRPTGCTVNKAHVTPMWSVRPRHLRRLLCAVVVMPLPQLKRRRRTTGRIAYLLLSRARTRIYCRDLRNVTGRYTVGPSGVVGACGHCPPSLGTRTETVYVRDALRLLRAVRSPPRASLSRLVSPTAGVFVTLHDFGAIPSLGRSKWLRSASLVIIWFCSDFCNIR